MVHRPPAGSSALACGTSQSKAGVSNASSLEMGASLMEVLNWSLSLVNSVGTAIRN